MKHIGFIGASGLMGHGMARNLLAKGFAVSLTVHRNKDGVADLLSAGARQVARPADLGACDAVILCVTGTPQVEAACTEALDQSTHSADVILNILSRKRDTHSAPCTKISSSRSVCSRMGGAHLSSRWPEIQFP